MGKCESLKIEDRRHRTISPLAGYIGPMRCCEQENGLLIRLSTRYYLPSIKCNTFYNL